jgi:membrane protein DedA with SNARE-associated domain
MDMQFTHALPFIVGFFLRGESALFVWLLYSANEPAQWVWICSFAVIASNLSFLFYYSLGYFSARYIKLYHPLNNLLEKISHLKINVRSAWLLLLLRFLLGVRNPIAAYLGMMKFPPFKFALFNFLGSLIWIAVWFGVFYFIRNETYAFLLRYKSVLYEGYIGVLMVGIGISIVTALITRKHRII